MENLWNLRQNLWSCGSHMHACQNRNVLFANAEDLAHKSLCETHKNLIQNQQHNAHMSLQVWLWCPFVQNCIIVRQQLKSCTIFLFKSPNNIYNTVQKQNINFKCGMICVQFGFLIDNCHSRWVWHWSWMMKVDCNFVVFFPDEPMLHDVVDEWTNKTRFPVLILLVFQQNVDVFECETLW